MSSAFTTNPARSLLRMTRLPQHLGGERARSLQRDVARHEAGDQLDESQHRHRVEEVDADHLLRPLGGGAELHDRDRAGVAGQDRSIGGDVAVELAEDVDLHALVLDDGLDHQLAIGEVGELGGEAQSATAASRCTSVSLPADRPRSSDFTSRARPASAAASFTSRTSTSNPARAHTSAMPEPIRPQPDHAHPFDLHVVVSHRPTILPGRDVRGPFELSAAGVQNVPMPADPRNEPDLTAPARAPRLWVGKPSPLGATYDGTGTNFALFSSIAEGVELCLFGDSTPRRPRRRDPDRRQRDRRPHLARVPPRRAVRASTTAGGCTARGTRPPACGATRRSC